MIEKTTDYSQFKLIKGNRELIPNHLVNLTVAIMKRNLLEANPILVNEKMEVIDGQHRLEVAKNNQLPIYYTVVEGVTINDVMMLNTNLRQWNSNDFVRSWAVQGNREYQWLLSFMEEYSLTLSQAALFIFSDTRRWTSDVFRTGKLRLTEEQRETGRRRADLFTEVRPYLTKRGKYPVAMLRAVIVLEEAGDAKTLVAGLKRHDKTLIAPLYVEEAVKLLKSVAR